MARNRNPSAAAAAAEVPSIPAAAAAPEKSGPQLGDVLPGFVAKTPWLRWLQKLSGEQRLVLGLSIFAAIVAIPWLGATGFWDPWEPEYGEVAREMVTRGDFLHPWYSYAWFFSKPALDLWLMALGMMAAGTNGAERWTGVYTEWCVRFPFALISAIGAIMLFVAASRLIGRRPALFGALGLITSPLFVFLSREAVPDPVYVGLLTAGMACLGIVLFEHEPAPGEVQSGFAPKSSISRRDGWVFAFYVFIGLGTLSKGLLAPGIPIGVVFLYCLITGEWFRLWRLRLLTGAIIVLAICAPWYGHMFAFDGRDEEGKSFFERFIIHDHFKRMFLGVHTTTPGGTFVYFIEQLGFNVFPWVFAVPGALARMGRARVRPQTRRERAELFVFLWILVSFALFAFSVTKFHHYAFPVLPPLLLACGMWIDDLLNDGLWPHAAELLAGGVFYGLVAHDLTIPAIANNNYPGPKHLTDMFVYNYDRTYPEKEVDPHPFFDPLFLAAPIVAISPWLFDRLAQIWSGLRALFSKAERQKLREAIAARLDGGPIGTSESPQDRKVLIGTLCTTAVLLACFLGWVHWRQLSVHWTQRDLFWTYYQQSTPDEPIAAYQMNWHGETFYSKNQARQIARANEPMISIPDYLSSPGKRHWFLVEQGRLNGLRQAIGNLARLRVVEPRNVKFVLAVAETNPMMNGSMQPGQPQPGQPQMQQIPSPFSPAQMQQMLQQQQQGASGGAPSAPAERPNNVGIPP